MDINKVTDEEIEILGCNIEDEEVDEYKEYNDQLIGTPYVFGYKGLQRKIKKVIMKNIKHFQILCRYQ